MTVDWPPRPTAGDRRARLEDVVPGSELVFPVRRLARDGLAAWKQVVECGYEGYVAKDESSGCEGGRSMRWLKVKQKGMDGRRGWLATADRRGGRLGRAERLTTASSR